MRRSWLIGLAAVVMGCGSQKVAPSAFPYLEPLLTAVSARNSDWLERSAKKLAEGEAALDSADAAELRRIHELARIGDWNAAKEAAYALRRASRR